MMSRRRWLAGWGLLAGTYLVLGTIPVAGGDPRSAPVYLVATAVTFGFAAAVLPLMVPRGREGGTGPTDGSAPSGGEPPSPPWWPEFEREFWSRVSAEGGGSPRDAEAVASADPGPRERTPA
jgi:hypothetical protein